MSLYVAMNRFRIGEGHEAAFEKRWRERNSRLDEVPGFRRFWLLRAPGEFISMSEWESAEAFEAWTRSDAFRASHAAAAKNPPPPGMYLGGPQMTGYEVVLAQSVATERPAGEPVFPSETP